MSKLIAELKAEHDEIIDALVMAKLLGAGSMCRQEIFMSAKERLLAHLKREDSELYPILRKAAETDKELRQNLDFMASDLEKVLKETFKFFEKYSMGVLGRKLKKDFAKDFKNLQTILLHRIYKEESTLFATFETIFQKMEWV